MRFHASFLTLECRYGQTSRDIFTKLLEVLALGIERISKKFQPKILRRTRVMEDLVDESRLSLGSGGVCRVKLHFASLGKRCAQTSRDILTKLSEDLPLGLKIISKKFQPKISRRSRVMEDLVDEKRVKLRKSPILPAKSKSSRKNSNF